MNVIIKNLPIGRSILGIYAFSTLASRSAVMDMVIFYFKSIR